MSDPGNDDTERVLRNMEHKLDKIYSRATHEAQEKLTDYLKRFERKDAEKQELVKAGKLSQDDYLEWRKRQMVTGDRYREMVNTLASDYAHTDKLAMSMVQGYMPEVYAINRNFSMYEIEHGSNIDVNYTLYNSRTVEKLVKEKGAILPKPSVEIPKDQRWNAVHIRGEITQGVLQGESIPKIAKRLQKITNMDKAAAVRNARTAVTTAQNTARLDTYKDAAKKGIGLKKMWVASLDHRTRASHVVLDGEMVDVDATFSNGMDCPGGSGPPEEVYNCRCRLVSHLTGFNFTDAPRNSKLGDMSYEQWKENAREKLERDQEKHSEFKVVQGRDISQTWQRRPDKFAFAIEDIMNAQGFDGKPRVVSAEEFDSYVHQANDGNGFVAQRTYSAPDQQTLDAYRDQLYNGKWYVDCSTGGSVYGQGMYANSSMNGEVTSYMRSRTKEYMLLNSRKFGDEPASNDSKLEMINAYIKSTGLNGASADATKIYLKNAAGISRPNSEEVQLVKEVLGNSGMKNLRQTGDLIKDSFEGSRSYIENFTLSSDARIGDYERLHSMALEANQDTGVYAAMLGYDAINVKSENYVIVLNRTKVIFKEP